MSNPEAIMTGLPKCTTLWDFDQLVGESGCDDERLDIHFVRDDSDLNCFGRHLQGKIERRYGRDIDPRTVIKTITKAK